MRGRRRRVLDEPEGRDCESSALVLTGCLAHQEHCAGAVFLMSPKEEIARVWLWSRLGVLLIKNITRARPQHDVRPGRQRVFLMSSKEKIARVRPWSRLGVLLIKNLTRARPPLDVRHPNGTHQLGHPAPRAECKHSKSITLWHAVFFRCKHWQALEERTTGMLFLKRERRQALAFGCAQATAARLA